MESQENRRGQDPARREESGSWLRYEPLFRSIVEHAWDMFLVLDESFHILYSSPSSVQVVGHRPDDLRGAHALGFVHPDDLSHVRAVMEGVLQYPGYPARFTHRVRDDGGNWRWMDTVVKNLLHDPEVAGLVVHSQDVTERTRLYSELHRARLESLRMRVHPHMIYNLLHSIRMCVQRDPEAAQEMIVMVGELLRLSFEHVGREEVTLEEELEFVQQYFEVEQIRFGPQLTATFELEAEVARALVPSLILQPLVENAVHHGFAGRAGAGAVHFSAWCEDGRLHLMVEDDGAGFTGREADEAGGIGLSSARLRLEQHYGAEARLAVDEGESGGACVHIELPFRTRTQGESGPA